MKKRWIIGFILAIAATLLSACNCGGNTGEKDDNSSQNGGQNTEGSVSDGFEDTDGADDSTEDDSPTPIVYTITYRAAPQSEISESVFNAIKKKLGVYPESYTEGVGVTVDDLRSDCIDATYAYTFIGWYYDEACLELCENGVIGTDKTGDVTLYAKVQKTLLSELDDESWGGS